MKARSKATVLPLRQRQRDFAQQEILDAAESAFAEHGLDAPMETIAARAGVAVGTLYNHFDSRAVLLEALMAARRKELLGAMSSAISATQGQPFPDRLRASLVTLVHAMEQRAQFKRMLFQADLPMKRTRRVAVSQEMGSVFQPLLQQGRDEGVLAPDPEGLQALLLASLIHTLLGCSIAGPSTLPLSRIPELVVQQFIHGAQAVKR